MSPIYEGWEVDAQAKEVDTQFGYERMVDMIMEDEQWAIDTFEAFHGREY